MSDLSHWDFVNYFTGFEAAALIIGIDPGNVSETQKHRIEPVQRAIPSSYLPPYHNPDSARDALAIEDYGLWIFSVQLKHALSIDTTNKAHSNLKALGKLNFEEQSFQGEEITRWLKALDMSSEYKFRPKIAIVSIEAQLDSAINDIDPADLPEELDVANMAFRAVMNGYGDKNATPRNRLIDYLSTTYPHLKTEAIQRIATVANPDKARGRKSLIKE